MTGDEMPSGTRIAEPVRQQLRLALVAERDLLEVVARADPRPVVGRPDLYHCSCRLTQPRPLDPETAEVRRVEIELRRIDDGWEICGVDGLDVAPEAGG